LKIESRNKELHCEKRTPKHDFGRHN